MELYSDFQQSSTLLLLFMDKKRSLYEGWNGHDLKGNDAPPAVYIYTVRVYSGDRMVEKNGSVLLIR